MWQYNYRYGGELYHYGVKGMKWGVRRYQNKDGSLTPEGKERYTALAKAKKNGIIKIKNRELTNGLSIKADPYSIVDKIDDSGKTLQRRKYDDKGRASVDFDTTDHGLAIKHPTGAHKHKFEYLDEQLRRSGPMSLTMKELKENSDIIKKGENYFEQSRIKRKD